MAGGLWLVTMSSRHAGPLVNRLPRRALCMEPTPGAVRTVFGATVASGCGRIGRRISSFERYALRLAVLFTSMPLLVARSSLQSYFLVFFMWVVAVFLVMQRNFAAWVSGECLRESKENSFGSHTLMSSFVAQPSDQSVLSAQ